MPKAYPPELRDAAIRTAAQEGVTAAAKAHGVGKATISRWCSEAGIGTVPNEQTQAATDAAALKRAALREQIGTELLVKALDMLTRMDEEHKDYRGKDADEVFWDKAPSGACQQYATAAAILIDKSQLLSGEATSRGEHVQIDPTDAELRRLAAELKSRA